MAKRDFRDKLGKSPYVAHLLPNSLTDAGFWFLLEASRITMTFHSYQWMSKFVTSTEWMVEDFAEYLELEKKPFDGMSPDGPSFYSLLIAQMIWADEIHYSKIVDAFISYLVDVIACAYRHNPSLIPSKARFDLDFVRKFKSINDAVRGSALAEIERVSRSGFSEIFSEAKHVTRCKVSNDIETRVKSVIKTRNEIVHQQGFYFQIIQSMFRKRQKSKNVFKHKPENTSKAEVIIAEAVGLFERSAIRTGIKKAATKREIFKGTDFLKPAL
jgi:hypothetical protein